jgi:hypothetical protein
LGLAATAIGSQEKGGEKSCPQILVFRAIALIEMRRNENGECAFRVHVLIWVMILLRFGERVAE